jgi:hypothetical protein
MRGLLQRTRAFDMGVSSGACRGQKGKLNPWWDILTRIAHHSPDPDLTQVGQTSAQPDSDLVEQAFTLFLRMDAEQRAGLIARQQDRMAKEPALNQPRRSSD